MPPAIDARQPNEPNEDSGEIQKPSRAVEETFLVYKALSGISNAEYKKLRERGTEIAVIVDDFGKDLVQSTREAAQLALVMREKYSPDQKRKNAASLAINQYSSDNPQDAEYVHALSPDLGKLIPEFLDKHYEARTKDEENRFNPVDRLYILELMAEVPSNLVKNPKGVNIESALIDAVIVYSTLKNARLKPGSASSEEFSKAVFAAEGVYLQLMENLGYDGVFMALKEELDGMHFKLDAKHFKQGNGEYDESGVYDGITQARLDTVDWIYDRLPPANEMPEILDGVVSTLTGKVAESKSVLRDVSGHGIQIGAGRITEEYTDEEMEDTIPSLEAERYVHRKKGRHSAARKVTHEIDIARDEKGNVIKDKDGKPIFRDSVMPISDLYGEVIIQPSTEALAYSFSNAAGILQDLNPPQLELITSRHKDTAFHAKVDEGNNSAIQAIEVDLGNLGARLDKKISDNGHKVVKITLQHKRKPGEMPVPIEVQFQTKDDRADSRTGAAAHSNKGRGYKTTPREVAITKELGKLPKRRAKTNEAGLTWQSIARGNAEFPRIAVDEETQRTLGAIAAQEHNPNS